jgi:hypothetical protein
MPSGRFFQFASARPDRRNHRVSRQPSQQATYHRPKNHRNQREWQDDLKREPWSEVQQSGTYRQSDSWRMNHRGESSQHRHTGARAEDEAEWCRSPPQTLSHRRLQPAEQPGYWVDRPELSKSRRKAAAGRPRRPRDRATSERRAALPSTGSRVRRDELACTSS